MESSTQVPALYEGLRELDRLAAVDRSGLLDSPGEETFDRVTRLVARLLGAPMALVSIVADERQYEKSAVGSEAPRSTPIAYSFCQHVVREDGPLVVDDAREETLLAGNPAIEERGAIAYIGVPLRDGDGIPLGALCAIDTQPRHWTASDLEILADLAAMLRTELQLREATRHLSVEARAERASRRHAEAESARRFRRIADNSADAIFIWRVDGGSELEYVSPAIHDLTGYSPDAFHADPSLAMRLIHPDDADAFRAAVQRPLEVPFEYRIRHRNGSYRWAAVVNTLVHGPDGRLEAIQGMVRDVDQRKRAGLALEHALEHERAASAYLRRLNEMKSTFLTAVSHELRTPLTSIQGFSELLVRRRDELTAEQQTLYLDRLSQNARRLERLLTDLLDIDRLNRGIISPRCDRIRIDRLVEEVVLDVNITSHPVRIEATPVEGWVDAAHLARIVENLVRNAVRHTPAGTAIEVTVAEGDDTIELTVCDRGPGVPDDLKAQMFDPFVQGPEAADAASPGTGAGLTLVRELATLNGGEVRVEDRDGGGACFRVRFRDRADATQDGAR